MSKLKDTLSQRWFTIQTSLFPWLSEELGELTDKQQELVNLRNDTDRRIYSFQLRLPWAAA